MCGSVLCTFDTSFVLRNSCGTLACTSTLAYQRASAWGGMVPLAPWLATSKRQLRDMSRQLTGPMSASTDCVATLLSLQQAVVAWLLTVDITGFSPVKVRWRDAHTLSSIRAGCFLDLPTLCKCLPYRWGTSILGDMPSRATITIMHSTMRG